MATSTLSGSDVGGRGPPRARRSLSAALRFAQRGRLKWLLCCLLCKAQLFPFQGRALWKVASAQKSACDPSMREPLQRQQWGHRKTPCCPLPSRHTASVRLAALPSPPPPRAAQTIPVTAFRGIQGHGPPLCFLLRCISGQTDFKANTHLENMACLANSTSSGDTATIWPVRVRRAHRGSSGSTIFFLHSKNIFPMLKG